MTQRLLSRHQAAAYCGISAPHFDATVAKEVPALQLGRRNLWDRKLLDRWLDVRSGITEEFRSIDDWLEGLGADRAHPRR
jgi:hypothetical protein